MNNGNAMNCKTFIATLEKRMERGKTINYLRAATDILCAGRKEMGFKMTRRRTSLMMTWVCLSERRSLGTT